MTCDYARLAIQNQGGGDKLLGGKTMEFVAAGVLVLVFIVGILFVSYKK